MQKKHKLTLVLAAALAGAAPAAAALAQQPAQPPTAPQEKKPQTKITLKDARTRALREVPGTVLKEELKQENGKWVYLFEIRPTGAPATAAGQTVRIDADSGAVLPKPGKGRTQGQ